MAINAASAKARRKLKAEGGRRLSSIAVPHPETWTEILDEKNLLPFWRDGKELTEEQMRHATERFIAELCHERRRAKADELLQRVAKTRTGAIEREPPPEPVEPPALFSTKHSAGGHWSFRPGNKKDKGHRLTGEELEDYLETRPDLQEARAKDIGMRVVGE